MDNNKHVDLKVTPPKEETKTFRDIKSEMNSLLSGDKVGFLRKMYEQAKELDPNSPCPSCADDPKNSACDVCGKGKTIKPINYFQIENKDTLSDLNIPQEFAVDTYNSQILVEDKRHITSKAFTDYLNKTNRLIQSFSRGEILRCSLYISAPSGFGKEHLVYSLMLTALDNGNTVFPYIDLNEAQQLINSYERGSSSDSIRKLIGYTDTDLYTSDVCILKVPHSENQSSYATALNIIDRRARRNKSTIIMSRYAFKYFTLQAGKEFSGIVKENASRPKNVAIIEFLK